MGLTVIDPGTLGALDGALVRVTGLATVGEIRLGVKDLVGVARDVRVCSGAAGAAVTVDVGAIWTALGADSAGGGGVDVVVVMVAADGGSPAMLNT